MLDKKLVIAIIKGLISFIPGYRYFWQKKRKKLRNSCSIAEFCYSFWLRMIVYNNEKNVNISYYQIGEIGTAGSLGLGICALLTGAKRYYALDIENNHGVHNIKLFDEIVILFKNETPIPSDIDNLNLKISEYGFPKELISLKYLDDEYILSLRKDLVNCLSYKKTTYFKIKQNWNLSVNLNLDFIFSRAVMEHVKNPDKVYLDIEKHLNTNGFMLHDIELHSHGLTKAPDGHFYLNKFIWFLIFGKREFLLNRWRFDEHMESINKYFKSISIIQNVHKNRLACVGEEAFGFAVLAKKKSNNFTVVE